MVYLLTTIHVIVCLFLVVVVLLQSGKAADLAGAFGGMGSQTVFGPRGSATVLSKATTIAAALFMVTSLIAVDPGDARAAERRRRSSIRQAKPVPAQTAARGAGAAGSTVPIQVTPSVNGEQGAAAVRPVPVPVTPTRRRTGKRSKSYPPAEVAELADALA